MTIPWLFDHLCRGPYNLLQVCGDGGDANIKSPELQEKLVYLDLTLVSYLQCFRL